MITPTGVGDVRVSIPTGVAVDRAGNRNSALASITVSNQKIAHSQERIVSFMQSRANASLANQPDLRNLLNRRAGQFNANSRRGFTAIDMSTRLGAPFWAQLTATTISSESAEADYAFGVIGARSRFNENLIIEGMLQLDYSKETDGTGAVSGTGWLIFRYQHQFRRARWSGCASGSRDVRGADTH